MGNRREDPRELHRGEKVFGAPRSAADWLLTGEKQRDRSDARRQIENLSQNDQIIALLGELVAEQQRTNQLLQWFADRAHAQDQNPPKG